MMVRRCQRHVSWSRLNGIMTTIGVVSEHVRPMLGLHRIVPDSPMDVGIARMVFDQCSNADIQARFGRSRPVAKLVEWLIPVHPRDLVLVAVTPDDDPVGLANANLAGPGLRELAVLVPEAWQRRGVGTFLVESIRSTATETLVGRMSAANHAARHLLNRTASDARSNVVWDEVEFEIPPRVCSHRERNQPVTESGSASTEPRR